MRKKLEQKTDFKTINNLASIIASIVKVLIDKICQ